MTSERLALVKSSLRRTAHRHITSVEVTWTLFKLIVLNRSTFRKIAAQPSDAFALTHELDFGKAKLLALGQILGRFVGQIGLPKRSINYCMNHDGCLRGSFSLVMRCNRSVIRIGRSSALAAPLRQLSA